MPVAGYVVPWCVRTGARVALHLSSADPEPRVSVVRLDDDAAEGTLGTTSALSGSVSPASYEQGSWLELPWQDASSVEDAWAISVEFLLTRNSGTRTLVEGRGVRLQLNDRGRLVCTADAGVESDAALDDNVWYVLELQQARAARLDVTIRRFDSGAAIVAASLALSRAATFTAAGLRIGSGSCEEPTLNARIGRVSITAGGARAHWTFAALGVHETLSPSTGSWPAIRVHNCPSFAVRSARWDGSCLDPQQNPAHYDAVHLHDDDLGHFDWEASHEFHVPGQAPSGVYAFEVQTSGGTERIPFFVRPARPSARLAFLVPTATYLAYADEYLPAATYPWRCWDRGHQFAQDNQLRSLYDVHGDGSGVSLSSRRRPKATLRDDALYPLSNSPHLLPVDLQFLRFCRRHGIAIELLTDHDLHAEGSAALAPYSGVFTGSHPEYWSAAMLAALDEFLAAGGHLAYLGGNGFYLSVALDGDLIELRRGSEDDIWASNSGEGHMALTGEMGGYWAARGRPSQSLVGSTFLMMGFGPSRPYRRLRASHAAEWAWLFAGVGDELIGEEGSVLGAAAGYEVDGVIEQWPQPHGLARLATADDFDDSFQLRRALLSPMAAGGGVPRRADMTIYRHAGGGLVFSTGSVAWCGALPARGQNAVGAITLNVARRFEERFDE